MVCKARVADHHRNDVAGIPQIRGFSHRQAGRRSSATRFCTRVRSACSFEMTNTGERAGRHMRRQRRREDKARCKAPNEVAQRRRSGDIAADDPESLRQRTFNHRETVAETARFPRYRRHEDRTDRQHEPRQGRSSRHAPRLRRKFGNRSDIAVHGVDWIQKRRASAHWDRRSAETCDRGLQDRYGRRFRVWARLWRIPSIIEAWFDWSESTTQPGMRDARVASAAQLETYPDVNNNASCLPWRSASSRSSRT